MAYLLQQLLNVLQLASLYGLIALGYSIVYGMLTMINFAHGDLFMVGAFFCLIAAVKFKLPFALSLTVAVLGTAALGVIIERLAYKPLRNAPRVSAVITALGVGIFLESFTLALCPYPQHIPALIPEHVFTHGGVSVSLLQIIIIALSFALMFGLDLFMSASRTGLAMRAIAWDASAVPLLGVPVNRVISVAFAIGAGLGGAAGVMYGLAYPVIDPYIGVMVGWKAFISAVVGGIGNVRGAMLGAFILAAVEVGSISILPSTYRDLVVFVLLFALLLVRPHGILGRPRVEKV